MAQQLKRWESPRREGRNSKGKGGSARQRQLRKQFKTLSQKLKQGDRNHDRYNNKGREQQFSPFAVSGAVSGANELDRVRMCYPIDQSLAA